jgi:hypothetical protein
MSIVNALARRVNDPALSAKTDQITDLAFALITIGGDAGPVCEVISNLASELETAMVRRGYSRQEIPGIIRGDCERAGLPVADGTVNVRKPGVGL